MFTIANMILLLLLFPQQEQEIPARTRIIIRVVSLENGKARLETLEIQRPNILDAELMLRQEEIKKEIEVVADQTQELDKLLDQVSRDSNRLAISWKRKPPTASHKRELAKVREKRNSELEEILLPIQFERLDEIENRLALRADGFLKFIEMNRQSLELQISNKNRTQITTELNRLVDEIRSDLQDEVKESLQTLLASLTSDQKKQLEQLQVDCGFIEDLDIHLVQLKYLEEHSFEFGLTSESRFEAMLEYSPSFIVSFDGRFQARKGGGDWTIIPRFVDEIAFKRGNLLELTTEQLESKGKANRQYWDRVRELQAMRSEQAKQTGRVTEQENDHFVEAMKLAAEEMNSSYRSILNAEQTQAIRTLHARKLRPQFGMVANLLRGDLGRELELTQTQTEKIEKQITIEIERLEKKLLDWDEKLLSAVQKKMEPDNRQKFSEAIGERMLHVVPTYRMLVEANNK